MPDLYAIIQEAKIRYADSSDEENIDDFADMVIEVAEDWSVL